METNHERALETFVEVYQVTLFRVEQYLEEVVEEAGPEFAAGYTPWLRSIRDLTRGAFLASNHVPLKNQEPFLDALRVFSFSSATQFLQDVCSTIGIKHDHTWAEKFKEQIRLMTVALQQGHYSETPK